MKRAKATNTSKCVFSDSMVASDQGVPDGLGCVLQRYNASRAAVTINPGGFVSWSKLCTADWLAWEQQPQPPSASCDVPRIDKLIRFRRNLSTLTCLRQGRTRARSCPRSCWDLAQEEPTNWETSVTPRRRIPRQARTRENTCRDRRGRKTPQDVGTLQKLRK